MAIVCLVAIAVSVGLVIDAVTDQLMHARFGAGGGGLATLYAARRFRRVTVTHTDERVIVEPQTAGRCRAAGASVVRTEARANNKGSWIGIAGVRYWVEGGPGRGLAQTLTE